MDRRPEAIIMVGVPSSGKSTWVAKHIQEHPEKDYVVISTDNELYDIGRENGLVDNTGSVRYMDVHLRYHCDGKNRSLDRLNRALKECRNVILDRPYHTKEYRARVLNSLPAHYLKTIVVMETPIDIILERWKTDPKGVPNFDLKRRLETFESVSRDEEFDLVIRITPCAEAESGVVFPNKEAARFVPGVIANAHTEWYDVSIFDGHIEKEL